MAGNGLSFANRRWLVWAGGGALAALIALVAAFIAVSRPPLSNGLLASLLSRPGAPAKVSGAYIGLGETRIASLTAPGLSVADLKANYGFPGLLFGNIKSVRARSIAATAQYQDGAVSVPIAGKIGGGKSAGPLNLPAIEADTIDVSLEGLPMSARLIGKLGLARLAGDNYRLNFAGNSNFGSDLPTEISATFDAKGDANFNVNAGLSGPGAPGNEPLAAAKPGLLIDRLVAQGALASGRVTKLDADLDLRSAHLEQADIGKSIAHFGLGPGTSNSFSINAGPIQLTEAYAKSVATKIEASYQTARSQEASASLASDLDAMIALLRGRWSLEGAGPISLVSDRTSGDQALRIEPRILAVAFPLDASERGNGLSVLVGSSAGSNDASHIDLKVGKKFTYAAHLGLDIQGAYPPHVKIGAIDAQSSADPKQASPLTLNDVAIDWPSKSVTLGLSAARIHYAPGTKAAVTFADAKVTADGALYQGVSAKALAADISGTVMDGGNKWLLAPTGSCYSAAFESLTIGPARIANGGLKACAKPNTPFAVIDASGAAPAHIEAMLTATPTVLGSVSMKDGIKIASLSAEVSADLGSAKPAIHLINVQGHIADAAKSVRFAPLDFSAAVDMANGETSGSIGATALDQVLLSAHLHQDAMGNGGLDFDSGALEFANKKVEIQKLLPVLTGLVTGAQGKLRIDGEMIWAAGKPPKSSGKVAFTGFGVTTKLGLIQGVDGTIALNRLWPARTPAPQTLKIKNAEVGLPLKDGTITINLPEKFALEIVKAAWPWAKGELAIVDGAFVPGQSVQHVAMTASGIDLDALTKILAIDGLSATGVVDGRLPIVIDKGDASIVAGALKARSGGVIKYTGSAGDAASAQGGEGANLLFTALKNFNYQKLDIGVDGPLTGNVTITLKLLGFNPEVYDGHSFEINIKVDSQLANLIIQTTRGLRVGTQIQEGLSRGQ
ncbi:MAG TPA: YdbH domain-containing protein [Alphaproteobacteria bacterium]|nr:YdbH domain-containing protein [Alphaproteobacteria bacterium]